MMGKRFLGSIDHGAKKASPTTQQKGKKDHEGNNDSELRGKGHRQKSLFVILAYCFQEVNFQAILPNCHYRIKYYNPMRCVRARTGPLGGEQQLSCPGDFSMIW